MPIGYLKNLKPHAAIWQCQSIYFSGSLGRTERLPEKLSTLSTLTPSKHKEFVHNPNLPPFFR
ncbi:hypothetical protein [Eikenella corrodens]|uniref:Uncharacterized protein n=1 Tax=Eikenella corrodens TaxID=539 RepID=A0A3S9SIM5_EIKCO|nr:hypothetical protein [Eikenella corrodens]AZR59340.1 hypothetical protein ELB75_04450 [Eikenella corrodens]